MTTFQVPQAVLFDMDGTLVDTEPYWLLAETELVEMHGGSWSHEDGLQMLGLALPDAAQVLQRNGVDMEGEQIIDHMTAKVVSHLHEEVPWRPGAIELVQSLKHAGYKTAIVTMSESPMARLVALSAGIGMFDDVVSGDMVTRGKPHPEPYLTAASALGVPISSCVAIEDSPPGVRSAVRSGAATIAVPSMMPLPERPEYTLWPTLLDRFSSDIEAVYRARRAL